MSYIANQSLPLPSSICSNVIEGLCDLELRGEQKESGSESESSYYPTKFPGRSLKQVKNVMSPISLSHSDGSSFSSFENGVRGSSSSKTNDKDTTPPTSKGLLGNTTRYDHGILSATTPPPLKTSSRLFRNGGVNEFLDTECNPMEKNKSRCVCVCVLCKELSL